MENEILLQILTELKEFKADTNKRFDKLEQGQAETNTRLDRVEQKVTKIEVTLENDIKLDIKAIAEGHGILNKKLDGLKDLNEKVIDLQTDTSLHKAAITELSKRTANLSQINWKSSE